MVWGGVEYCSMVSIEKTGVVLISDVTRVIWWVK